MALLNQQQLEAVAQAVQSAEKETDAELVAVLAARADNYYYIPALWAALLALLMPAVLMLTPYWIDENTLFKIQWVTFIIAIGLFRLPTIMMKLVPASIKRERAGNLARRQFLENNLHHTKGETGVLVFVSEAEHYVEIIADRGINQQVDSEQWQHIVDDLTAKIKVGDAQQGFIDCIDSCAKLLQQLVPATSEKNELPNHFILL